MRKLAIPFTALILSYLIFFGYIYVSYPELPARFASHFDIEGQPNGWMSRDTCVAFSIALGLLLPALIIGMMAGAGRIPVSFVNLPHRDYWLAPERRQAALAVLLRYSLWLASMNILFVTGLHWLIVQSNLPSLPPHLSGRGIGLVVGGFLSAMAIWVILLLLQFSKTT